MYPPPPVPLPAEARRGKLQINSILAPFLAKQRAEREEIARRAILAKSRTAVMGVGGWLYADTDVNLLKIFHLF